MSAIKHRVVHRDNAQLTARYGEIRLRLASTVDMAAKYLDTRPNETERRFVVAVQHHAQVLLGILDSFEVRGRSGLRRRGNTITTDRAPCARHYTIAG